ncbi:SGNH/GDSL hydrolase family protein [Serratia fonticola]
MPTQNPVPSNSFEDLLFNAEKFDQVMTGVLLTYTDRLGNVRYTIAGLESKNNDLIASLTANYANVVNNLTPLGKVYSNLSSADAAIASGEIANGDTFFIRSSSGNSIANEYQNISGVATATGRGYPTTQFVESISDKLDSISGCNPSMVPQIFESTQADIPALVIKNKDGDIVGEVPDRRIPELEKNALKVNFYETVIPAPPGEVSILNGEKKIVTTLASAASVQELQSTSLKSGFFETVIVLDDVFLTDANGKVLATIGDTAQIVAELALAAGNQTSISQRLNNGLTPFGDPLGPYASRWSIREVRMRLEKLAAGDSTQLTIGLLGDSYSNDKSYYSMQFAKQLQDQYGMAGVGWIGFGWYGPASGTWTSVTQPVGISGSIRTDLSPICQVIGTWTCTYGQPSTNAPALYKISSSTVDDYVRFTVPPAGGAYANSCRLFYSSDGTGVIQVSWDDGATWSSNINLATVGAGNINLAGTPAADCIARIKVVSGNVGLAGVDSQSTAPGVRIHKLGCSGSTAAQWAGVGAQWGVQMTALSCKCHQVMLGTNDQGVATPPSTFASNLAIIFANLNAILPYSDRALVTPAENQRTNNVYKMPLYAQAARDFAITNDIGFCDLQTFFGSPDNYAFAYAYANPARPWYASDLIHPDGLTGGRAIASALNRFYTQI